MVITLIKTISPKIKLLYLISLIYSNLISQDYHIKKYTTHDGLPQVQVTDLIQDDEGYIFVGTKSGLSVFNGSIFRNYNIKSEVQTNVRAIHLDEEGNKYIYANTNIYKFDNFNFTKINVPKALRIGFGVFRSNFVLLMNDSITTIFNLKDQLKTDSFTSNYTLKAISKDTLYLFERKEKKLYRRHKGEIDLIMDFSRKAKLFEFSINKRNYTSYQEDNLIHVYSYQEQKTVLSLEAKTLKVIFKYNDQINFTFIENEVYQLINDHAEKINIPGEKQIRSLWTDFDNNLWFHHEPGMYCLLNSPFKYFDYPQIMDIWTLEKDNQNNFHLFSYNYGYKKFKNEINFLNLINTKSEFRKYYFGSNIVDDEIIIPTAFGVQKLNTKSNKSQNLELGSSLVSFLEKTNGNVIIGLNKAIGVLNKDDISKYDLSDYLDRYVVSIVRWHQKYIIGTYSDVIILNEDYTFYSNLNPNVSIDNEGAVSSYVDSRNNLWVGNQTGLYFARSLNDTLISVLAENIRGIVLSITEYDENLIIGTSNEIVALDLNAFYEKQEKRIVRYNYNNGMLCEEIAQNGFKIIENQIYIPSSTYLGVIDPQRIDYSSKFLNLKILSINNNIVNADSIININSKDALFKYEAIGFNRPSVTEYRYKLNEGKWSEWTTDTYCNLSHCKEGRNTFFIQSKTAGFDKFVQTSASFLVSSPFHKTNSFLVLLGIFLMTMLFILIVTFLNNFRLIQKKKSKEQELKYLKVRTLQTQMNPHFIFNVLGTLQNTILKESKEIANEQLIKLSELIRMFLNSSTKDDVLSMTDNCHTIGEEIKLLELYLSFEKRQYGEQINYNIEFQDDINLSMVLPPFIVQPYVENAIKHGILEKSTPGNVIIGIMEFNNFLHIYIEDDGIGISKSKSIRENSIKKYKSLGSKLTKERIDLLNEMGHNIEVEILDRNINGTIVKIKIKQIYETKNDNN